MMYKKLLLALLLTAAATSASAYTWSAPNSFDTVRKGSWDYKAAYTLCQEGKAPDYTTAFFDRELTRYELASVIKNALDYTEPPERSEDLNKLKKAYERELEAQGYTEKKKRGSDAKPLYEIHGDTRLRTGSEKTDARARVEGTWHITRNTDVVAGGKAEKKM